MQALTSFARYTKSLVNTFSANYHFPTQKPFLKANVADLGDTRIVGHLLSTNIPKRSRRAMRGIFHGKETKSGNYYTESRQARRRIWRPNVLDKNMYSEILGRKLNLEVSTKAMRCIRKYGGFDNYILLTKPSKMNSLYGEYLRKLMMTKLNNPEFKTPYIVKSRPVKRGTVKRHRYARRPKLFVPKDIRFTDLTSQRVKLPHEMSKKELAVFNEMESLNSNFQDMQTNHPLVRDLEEDAAKQKALLEPDRQKVMDAWARKKSKKQKERVLELFEMNEDNM